MTYGLSEEPLRVTSFVIGNYSREDRRRDEKETLTSAYRIFDYGSLSIFVCGRLKLLKKCTFKYLVYEAKRSHKKRARYRKALGRIRMPILRAIGPLLARLYEICKLQNI